MFRVMPGLHHVTAISGAPQENVDVYTARLHQRLIKKTVNFDDPGTYHLYYGSHQADPGTVSTFFPFVDAGPGHGLRGRLRRDTRWTGRLGGPGPAEAQRTGTVDRSGCPRGAGHGVVEQEIRYVRDLLNRS